MKWSLSSLLLVLVLAVTACGGNPAPAAAPVQAGVEIDLSTLADLIDPQTVAAIKDRPEVMVIDVREQSEYDQMHIAGATLMPMNTIPNRLSEIPKDKTVVLHCHSGRRSSEVASYLRDQGFTNIHDMAGGIAAWQSAGLPTQ